MKRQNLTFVVATIAAIAMATSQLQAANQLTDPSIEDPLTFDGPPFVGFWEGFAGSANASSINDTTMPRTGPGHATIAILGDDNSFAGIFQDLPISDGQPVSASIYHKTPDTGVLGVAPEFRIEFRDAGGNELSRVENNGVVPTDSYTIVDVAGAAPAGSAFARMVYAVQTFVNEPDGGASNSGTVFVDDAFMMVVPEPTSVALLGLGGLALVAWRRRS